MYEIEKIINWFEEKKKKGVCYSMIHRYGVDNDNGVESYDCSSAIYYSCLQAFNIQNDWVRTTSSLPSFLENLGFKKIAENEEWHAKRGDIVIWQRVKGQSGSFAHTGIFTDNTHIIHCNYNANGISEDEETKLIKDGLYGWNYRVFRFEERQDNPKNYFEEHVTIKNGGYSIDTLPWECGEHTLLDNTDKHVGKEVTITRRWGSYYYCKELNGWIDYKAFE